jgi:hypothetical protein
MMVGIVVDFSLDSSNEWSCWSGVALIFSFVSNVPERHLPYYKMKDDVSCDVGCVIDPQTIAIVQNFNPVSRRNINDSTSDFLRCFSSEYSSRTSVTGIPHDPTPDHTLRKKRCRSLVSNNSMKRTLVVIKKSKWVYW